MPKPVIELKLYKVDVSVKAGIVTSFEVSAQNEMEAIRKAADNLKIKVKEA